MEFLQPSFHNPGENPAGRRFPSRINDLWTSDINTAGFARLPPALTPTGGVLEYWCILNRRKWTLLVFALVCTSIAYVLTRMQAPVYRARTLVEVESLNENFLNMRNVSPTAENGPAQSPEYNIHTQIKILQSRTVLERTLQKVNLEKRLLASSEKHKSPISSLFSFSKKQLLSKAEKEAKAHEQAMDMAANNLNVQPETNSRILSASFNSTDPTVTADFVNSLMTAFTEVTLENRWRSTQNTSEWLSRQLQDVKIKLEKSQDELQKYAHAENLTFLSETNPTGQTTTEQRLKELEGELTKAQTDRIVKQSAYEQVNNAPAESLPEVIDNPTLKDYQIQLTTLRRQLADLSSSFTPQYPKVVSIKAQIAALENALEKERANILSRTRNEYDIAMRREKLMNQHYAALTNLITTQSEKVSHYMLLKHEFDSTRQLYESLIQRVKEADLASAMKATDVHVIEAAVVPHIPYRPIQAVNMAFGFFSGIFLGVAFIVQRARAYRGIQEPGDAVFELNVPELGVIPATTINPSQFRRLLGNPSPKTDRRRPELTSWEESPSMIAEAFRLTLTSLLLASNDGEQPKVIAISSANPNEGKTTVVSNLAIALARIDRRVLLIDGDLRKGRLHRIFEADNSRGLKESLEGDASVSFQQTQIPNLSILPTGKGVSETLFFSSKLRDLLHRLRPQFDVILIDTPPLLQISDARLICHEADTVVLVVAQHTLRETALQARQRLVDDGSKLIGAVLNRWDPKTSVTGYGYGDYHKYKKYYEQKPV
ncbi:MAG: polysaccharide biosynthesis tyrosine autokinase [Acidobacteriaceae bacterium]|nr:polysaccharide biosynthesis tyrosine autokinase [Acidobacteriaceae bacterium]